MFIDYSLNDFIDITASGAPTPGGGSVCALAAALGAALSSMVGELTAGKESDKETADRVKATISTCKDLMKDFKAGVDEDTKVFDKVMAAYKMPKATDDEKKVRSCAIQNALKEAAELPYDTAKLALDVMNVACDMLKIGNRNAASDASVSGYLAYAALNGALYNVKINLNSIKDTLYVNQMKAEVEQLISESEAVLDKIKKLSAEVIG